MNDELFENLHRVVDSILRDYFRLETGITSAESQTFRIPSNQISDFDVEIVLGGRRRRGKQSYVYLNLSKAESGTRMQLRLTVDKAPEQRDLQLVLGAQVGVYSLFHGVLRSGGSVEGPEDLGHVDKIGNAVKILVQKATRSLEEWRQEYFAKRDSKKVDEEVKRLFEFIDSPPELGNE